MEIILLEKIDKLGALGEQVKVKPGYARNYLIPKGKAKLATEENKKLFEAMRAELEKKAQEKVSEAQQRAEKLKDLVVTIPALSSEEGKLYGSVSAVDIVKRITDAVGIEINKSEILLPEGPIHSLGEYTIGVRLHSDVEVPLQIHIVSEKQA